MVVLVGGDLHFVVGAAMSDLERKIPVGDNETVIRRAVGNRAPTEREGGPVLRRVINGGSAAKLPPGRPEARTRSTTCICCRLFSWCIVRVTN